LQKFLLNVDLEEDACVEMIFNTLNIPEGEEVILILDRTYWMHGKTHLNFLYLSIYYRGYGIPIYFRILPDIKGHSGVGVRKELIEKFTTKFGKERIAYIVSDREFDGNEWLSYLKSQKIDFVQRLKENSINMTNIRGNLSVQLLYVTIYNLMR
jgi:hypothetical protein